MTHDLIMEQPLISDISSILNLYNKHLLQYITQEQIKEGFIKVTYNAANFKDIIADNAIVILKNQNTIVGYYLLGHSSKSKSLSYQFDALNRYSMEGTRLCDLKVACGAQAVLEKDFREKGLTEKMLQQLIIQVKHNYNFLFCSVTKSNFNAYKVHINSGYIIVGEDETKYFVCLNLNNL